MTDRSAEIRKADVTVEMTGQLDQAVNDQYPIIGRVTDALKLFKGRINPHLAFKVDAIAPVDRAAILHDALTHASDPNDAAYCVHGAEHHVFDEAMGQLVKSVDEFTATYRWSEIVLEDVDKYPIRKKRLIVETPPFKRKTARPEPLVLATEWKKRGKNINVAKEIRMRCLQGQDGFASALIAGVYAGHSEETLVTIFDNKDFHDSLLRQHLPKTLLFHRKEPKDTMLIRDLQRLLTVTTNEGRLPKFEFDSYVSALALLEKNHIIEKNGIARDELRMQEVEEPVIGRAVFCGLEEVAEKLSPPTLLDPKKTQYIGERFGNHATTRLLTAFLVFK